MDIFVLDTKLNLSKAYLKPGYAFGGSCLPKDLRALRHKAREIDVDIPLLEAVLGSNEIQKHRGFQLVRKTGCKKVGILGLSFKNHTDDLRESPYVELAEMLVGKGYEVMIYDENVSLSSLMGANLAYIQRELPHLSKLLRSTVDEIFDSAEVVVLTNNHVPLDGILKKLRPEQHLVDLARTVPANTLSCNYEGICW
jgi:GDP-mannose 6-dehydrogenase